MLGVFGVFGVILVFDVFEVLGVPTLVLVLSAQPTGTGNPKGADAGLDVSEAIDGSKTIDETGIRGLIESGLR